MQDYRSLDAMVRARLKRWPQHPPGLDSDGTWLRGRPIEQSEISQPFLKLPGSFRLRTLPDGLWLNFGGSPVEPFVDIFAVEACSSLQNLLDKRSRFAPSTNSLLAVCPVPWLLAPVRMGAEEESTIPRWRATGVLRVAPALPLVLPVRDLRVMYGLKSRQYAGFTRSQVPQAHEYFVPMEALTAEDGDKSAALRTLVGRAHARANFLPAEAPASGAEMLPV